MTVTGASSGMHIKTTIKPYSGLSPEEALKMLKIGSAMILELDTKAYWLTNQEELSGELFGSVVIFQRTSFNSKATGTIKRKNFT